MLPIPSTVLSAPTAQVLDEMQQAVLIGRKKEANDYPTQVSKAKGLWDRKTGTPKRKAAFAEIRNELERLCYGFARCAYCEDSAAHEIEHMRPKSLFPELAFRWANYSFACRPCNGPKSNAFATVDAAGNLSDFVRDPAAPVVPPPPGTGALIDPRAEDPTTLLELDLGGTAPDGTVLEPTCEFQPALGLTPEKVGRANYTIKVLGLNREVVRKSRVNAFGSFRARMREYADLKEKAQPPAELDKLKNGFLGMPHLTVFFEMRRQRQYLPVVDALLNRAPEIKAWPIVPGG